MFCFYTISASVLGFSKLWLALHQSSKITSLTRAFLFPPHCALRSKEETQKREEKNSDSEGNFSVRLMMLEHGKVWGFEAKIKVLEAEGRKYRAPVSRRSCVDCGWTGLLSRCMEMGPDRSILCVGIYLGWEWTTLSTYMNIYLAGKFTGVCAEWQIVVFKATIYMLSPYSHLQLSLI